jgi:hypothetical protein
MESEFRYRLIREAFVGREEPTPTPDHAPDVLTPEPGLTRKIDRRRSDPGLTEPEPRRTGDPEQPADTRSREEIRRLRDALLIADGVRDRLMGQLADAVHAATRPETR